MSFYFYELIYLEFAGDQTQFHVCQAETGLQATSQLLFSVFLNLKKNFLKKILNAVFLLDAGNFHTHV